MALYDNDTDQATLPRATSGQLPQAIARKNARRGGTPNAPEVDDEPAPASNDGSAAPVNTDVGQAIAGSIPGAGAAMDTADQIRQAYKQGGIGSAIGAGARGVLATGVAYGADQLAGIRPAWDAAAQGLKTFATGDASPIGSTPATSPISSAAAAPAPAATPTAPSIASAPQPGAFDASGDAAPSTGRSGAPLPAGIVRTGNAYSGSGQPVAEPFGPAGSDLNPGAYHQQYLAMQAKEAADQQANRTRNLATGNALQLGQDAAKAESEARVARFHAANGADMILGSPGLYAAQRAAIVGQASEATAKAAGVQGAAYAANKNLETAGNQDQIGDAARQGQTIAGGVAATQGAQQNVLMNPLHVEKLKQDIASGGTAQKIAETVLHAHDREQSMIDQMQNETDPARREQMLGEIMALRGQSKVAIVDQDTGQRDNMGNPIFKKVAVNTASGQFLEPSGAMGGGTAPPPGAIAALQKDPSLAGAFEQKYGLPKGGSAQFLKKGQ